MSKSILISIKPQFCSLIARGKKTIEVRKSRPKIETPFKCYIYCTKAPKGWVRLDKNVQMDTKVIGEFVCDKIYQYSTVNLEGVDISDEDMIRFSCLSKMELCDYETSAEPKENCIYLVGLYGWHISDLVIYDEPKELSEFCIPCAEFEKDYPKCRNCDYYYSESNECVGFYDECCCEGLKPVKRPPQSWCYVEGVNE